MRKFITRFAYMAAAILCTVTLMSCGDDDEIKPEDKEQEIVKPGEEDEPEAKHTYAANFLLDTKSAEVAESVLFQSIKSDAESDLIKRIGIINNEAEADSVWAQYTTKKEIEESQADLDQIAKMLKDSTLYCTFSILCDSEAWKSMTLTTNYGKNE